MKTRLFFVPRKVLNDVTDGDFPLPGSDTLANVFWVSPSLPLLCLPSIKMSGDEREGKGDLRSDITKNRCFVIFVMTNVRPCH